MDQEQKLHHVKRVVEALDDIIRNAKHAKAAMSIYETGAHFELHHQNQLDDAMNRICVIRESYFESAHGELLELGANGGL